MNGPSPMWTQKDNNLSVDGFARNENNEIRDHEASQDRYLALPITQTTGETETIHNTITVDRRQ